MSQNTTKIATTVAKLKKEYINQLQTLCVEMEALATVDSQPLPSMETLVRLTQIAHRLAGSGATFGMNSVSDAGQSLEKLLLGLIEQAEKKTSSLAAQKQLADDIANTLMICRLAIGNSEHQELPASEEIDANTKAILILAHDEEGDIARLKEQLSYLGYHYEQVSEFPLLAMAVKSYQPAAIIIHTDFTDTDRDAIERYLETIDRSVKPLPILYLSHHNNFDTRLTAVRLEGTAFSVLPLDHIELIDQLGMLTQHQNSQNYHILIVDDDEMLANRYSIALENAGMTVTVLTDPKGVIDTLRNSTIDMVLLDFHMPECNGFELASLLRQFNPYLTLPILFLSTQIHLDQFMRNARLGIDEFLTKPVTAEKLVEVVSERGERSRVLRRFMDQDSATGLLNHSSLERELSLEVARANRKKTIFSYAMLDIDHFKHINDSFGHATGDLVIRTLAHLLRQRLRYTDIIGRYGGEEFSVILPDTNVEQALIVLGDVHKQFSEFTFNADTKPFHVTFSGGIAGFPSFPSELPLNHAADKALYEAKTTGRNQLLIATP